MRPWHTFVITFAIAFILALGNGLGFFESTLSAFIAGILASVAFQILLWIFKQAHSTFYKPFKVVLLFGQYRPDAEKSFYYKTNKIVGVHGLWGPYTVEIKSRISTKIEEFNLRFVKWYFYKDGKFCQHHDVDRKIVDMMGMSSPYRHNVREKLDIVPGEAESKIILQMEPDRKGGESGKYLPIEQSPRGHKLWYQLCPPHIHVTGKYKCKISLKHTKGGTRITRSRKKIQIIHRTIEEQLSIERHHSGLERLSDFGVQVPIFKPLIPYIPMSLNRGATN